MLYECQPMALLTERAGGKATSGKERILDIKISQLHQRSPVIMGSSNMVNDLLSKIGQKEIA
jgi:fructose-1,6-bisphosphatase I